MAFIGRVALFRYDDDSEGEKGGGRGRWVPKYSAAGEDSYRALGNSVAFDSNRGSAAVLVAGYLDGGHVARVYDVVPRGAGGGGDCDDDGAALGFPPPPPPVFPVPVYDKEACRNDHSITIGAANPVAVVAASGQVMGYEDSIGFAGIGNSTFNFVDLDNNGVGAIQRERNGPRGDPLFCRWQQQQQQQQASSQFFGASVLAAR